MDNSLQYKKAVSYRGGNVAVSASAGCGKTTTMIKRIENIIVTEKINVTQLLVVTFTRAAAAEMKQKLKNTLLAYSPESFEYKQALELDIADISTIHSFCSRICSEFFGIADISPDFSILEDNDAVLYKNKILIDLIEDYYNKTDPLFNELCEIFSYDRSEDGLIKAVQRLYFIAVNLPDPEKFLKEGAFACCEDILEKNPAAMFLNDNLFEASNCYIHELSRIQSMCEKYGLSANLPLLAELKLKLAEIDRYKGIEENLCVMDNLFEILQKRIVPQKTEGGSIEETLHNSVKEIKNKIKDEFGKIYGDMLPLKDPCLKEKSATVKRHLEKLCEITLGLYNAYKQYKKDNALLDFNDLEHYTYRILKDEESRKTIQNRYRYIFVDEFQDINRIQDEIIGLMEKDGNLFIVGDFKQSIYRFRGAENEIFREKTQSNSFEQINLKTNFRSDKNLLAFVNEVFEPVMRESFSLVNYSDSGMLSGDCSYSLSDGRPAVIVDILEKKKNSSSEFKGLYSVKEHSEQYNDEENANAVNEGRHIASEINRLINSNVKIVLDECSLKKRKEEGKDEYLRYDDITVLVRAKKSFSQRLYGELLKASIPVSAEFSNSINEYFEIIQIIDYLKLIDNFKQDIPLLASLSGVFGGFNDDEIAQIRLNVPVGSFYEAFLEYIKRDDELAKRFLDFHKRTEEYARLGRLMPCPRLIMKIIKDSKYEEYLLSLENGKENAARLNTFLSMIYGKAYSYDITEFLWYIENASDEIKLNSKSEGELNRVRLCTIHTSKGLEYPVVFVAGCGERFLFLERRDKLIMNTKYGLATDFYDYPSRSVQKTFMKNALSKISDYEQVREEINTLYVAMTRAKYRLYMCGTADVTGFIPLNSIYSIKNARTYYDFVLNAAVKNKKNADKFPSCIGFEKNSDLQYELNINPDDTENITQICKKEQIQKETEALSKYKYIDSTTQPFKNTVTALNRYKTLLSYDEEEPASFSVSGKNFADTGTAYHKVLANVPFGIGGAELSSYINKLTEKGRLNNSEQPEELDIKLIERIINLPILNSGLKQYRELPFITFWESENGKKDEILLQGVIDLLLIDENEITVIDYKYSSNNASSLKQNYGKQLELYANAAKKILGYNSAKKIIINIKKCEVIEL